jgi:orotate phosphoribosyltransferase-like protein
MPPESVMRGEKHPNSVLTEAIVTEAKAMRASGVMFKDIAKALNVNEETITGAVNGKHWAHLK